MKLWFIECELCAHFNCTFRKCNLVLFKPRSVDGVCGWYEGAKK